MTAQQLKASILQLAIQGKLVPQNPEDEPASVLLKKIKAEKDALVKAGTIKKDKHESVIVRNEDGRYLEKKDGKTTDITDEIPFDIPDSWEWTRLGTMVDKFQYGTAEKSSLSGKVPVLRMGNLQNGEIDYTKLVFSSNENDIQQYKLHFGDLLFNRTNSAELVGKTSVFRSDTDAIFAGYLIRFRPILANSFYVNFVMNSSYQRGYCQSVRSDAINQSNINAQKLSLFLVPLPPLEEQVRIVAKIEELLPHVEEYGKAETALSKLNAELPEQLKKSILQWAIQGRLVPQDPTDEPASELLKRIKAEKSALIKSGKLKPDKHESVISRDEDGHYIEKKDGKSTDITDEIPFDIPASWEWVRLGSLTHLIMGQSPDGNTIKQGGVGIEFHQGKIYFGERYLERSPFITTAPTRIVPENSVLICVRAPVGVVNISPRSVCIGRGLAAAIPLGTVSERFLAYWILTQKHTLISCATGSTFLAVSGDQVRNLLLPLPPLTEQKQIVEKLDTVMSTLQTL